MVVRMKRKFHQIKLMKYRLDRNLSQCDLSKISGINQCTICLIESGKRMPNLITLVKLSKALECSTDSLIGELVDD